MDRNRFTEREQAWKRLREWEETAPRGVLDLRSRIEWYESARRLAADRWRPDTQYLGEKV